MNAQLTRPLVPTLSVDGDSCLAEAIARRWTVLWARLNELDPNQGHPQELRERERLQHSLCAAQDALDAQLEWVRAGTLAGVLGQVLRLRALAYEGMFEVETECEKREVLARFDRLNILALDALEEIAGLDGEALGKRARTYRPPEFEEVLEQLL